MLSVQVAEDGFRVVAPSELMNAGVDVVREMDERAAEGAGTGVWATSLVPEPAAVFFPSG